MRRTFHLGIENTRHAYRRIDTLPVPVFLCPALQYTSAIRYIPPGLNASVPRKSSALKQKFQSYVTTAQVEHADVDSVPLQVRDGLPFSCPGCGALTQTADPDGAGFYSRTRKSIKALARDKSRKHEDEATRQVYESALANVGEDVLKQLGVDSSSTEGMLSATRSTLQCNC